MPFIGNDNPLARNLVGAAQLLALARVLEKRGLQTREIGHVLYLVARAIF